MAAKRATFTEIAGHDFGVVRRMGDRAADWDRERKSPLIIEKPRRV